MMQICKTILIICSSFYLPQPFSLAAVDINLPCYAGHTNYHLMVFIITILGVVNDQIILERENLQSAPQTNQSHNVFQITSSGAGPASMKIRN